MDIIVGTAAIIVIGVLVYAFLSGTSGVSGKPIYTSWGVFPPGLGELETEYDYRMFDLDDGTTQFEY